MQLDSFNLRDRNLSKLALKLGYDVKELINITSNLKNHYSKYIITKREKRRPIYPPDIKLKELQRKINNVILAQIPTSNSFHGYRKKRSNITNARCHIGKRVISKLDIKDFFPNIHFTRILDFFHKIGFNDVESRILTRLTTADNYLPLGFSTSPILANLILKNLDKRLKNLFESIGLNCTYTFFSDDITISANCEIKKLENLICKIFKQEGFKINKDKIRYQYWWERQEVTKIVVNKKLNINREDRNNLKAIIHNCRILRPSTQIDKFWELFGSPKKGGKTLSVFKNRLLGKLSYIKPINPEIYNKLLAEYRQVAWSN